MQSNPVSIPQQKKLIAREAQLINKIKHAVITVSEQYLHYLVEDHYSGQLVKKIDVVELGIDQTMFKAKRYGDQKSMVFVGSLEARKNIIFLLKVFARISMKSNDYKLTIIGDGPEMGLLKKYTQDNKLKVTFLGSLKHDAVIYEMHVHGIYIHTSIKESFSYALLEAKLAGLKTFAYSKLQVPSEFIDVAIDSFEVDEWCNRILNMDIASPEFIASKFTVENMMARTVAMAS